MTLRGCAADVDGGGMYATAGVTFGDQSDQTALTTSLIENTAAGSGGAIMALGCSALLLVESQHRLVVANNTATLDGGGVGLDNGASIRVAPEACDSLACEAAMVGDGTCDAVCMTRGCGW